MTALRRLALGIVVVLLADPALAATRYDPRLHFRTTRTAHFDIHWHQGEEALAMRLAGIVEAVRARLEPELGLVRSRVQIVLVDQTDFSNGFAIPVPYDTIEIDARPPALGSMIGNVTDWLEVVFTHEYTHILHLDRSRGVWGGVRRVFGRVPIAFPNLFLPVWQVEGIATYEESRQTSLGRVSSGEFRIIVDRVAHQPAFATLDRASGGLDDWPGGNSAYTYGAYFHQFLADRYGPERLAALRDATAGRVPYLSAPAFGQVFGKSLGTLWKEFEDARAVTTTPPSATDAAATRLTTHGFTIDALTVRGRDVFYLAADPHGYPSLMRIRSGQPPEWLAWRAGGERTTVHGTWVVFDQVAPVRAVASYSDLYAVGASGGQVHRLTREARSAEPAFSPDGRRLACSVEYEGRRAIALLPFDPMHRAAPELLAADPEADLGGPQWSPDGQTLLVESRRGGRFEVATIDLAGGRISVLLQSEHRMAWPSWSADGRTILFSAERGNQPFNVFALDVASGGVRQVTDSVTGARQPQLSADGTVLTYVGYTPSGYDLFSVAVNADTWKPVAHNVFHAGPTGAVTPASGPPESRPYSPWRTLRPTYWSPLITTDANELVIGAGTAMTDVLGRHAYAVDAGWSTRARPDWQASYAYDRWRPTLFASYSDDTDPVRGGEVRSRELVAGMLLPFRVIRRSETLFAAVDTEQDDLACDGPCTARVTQLRRSAAQAGWLHDTRRAYGYSISVDEGHTVGVRVEGGGGALGSDVTASAGIVDARIYQRIGASQVVLAARGAAAVSSGALNERRVFSAAGSGPAFVGFDFGRDAIGLLRGFASEDVVGSRAAVGNLDVRFPLAQPQRGHGTLPLFVRSIHAAGFLDVGHAWDTRFRSGDLRTSAGGELSANLVLGHYLPVTVTGGAAWIRDPVVHRRTVAAFGRIGYAF